MEDSKKKEEALKSANNEILEIMKTHKELEELLDKLTGAGLLDEEVYVQLLTREEELLNKSKDAFEKAAKAAKELLEFKREEETKLMGEEDLMSKGNGGGGKRGSRKRSSSKKKKTRRKRRR